MTIVHLESWPPHYDDEPWLWSFAINKSRGFESEVNILGVTTNWNPLFNWLTSLILDLSPLSFWATARLFSLLWAFAIGLFSYRFFVNQGYKISPHIFFPIYLFLPLFDVLRYARTESFALALMWLGLLLAHRGNLLSALLVIAVAISIHPLTMILLALLTRNRSSIREFTKHFFFFVLVILALNIYRVTSFGSNLDLFQWIGSSSNLFDDKKSITELLMGTLRRIQFFSIAILPFLVCLLVILLTTLIWHNKSKLVDTSSNAIGKRTRISANFVLRVTLSFALFSILVARTEPTYFVFFHPIIVLLCSLFCEHKLKKAFFVFGACVVVLKMILVGFFSHEFNRFTPVQYAMNIDSPGQYVNQLSNLFPKGAFVIGPPVTLPALADRNDITFRGFYSITRMKNGRLQIPKCSELRKQISDNAQGKEVILILFHRWQLEQFRQYDQSFDKNEFDCLLRNSNTRQFFGRNSDGSPWSWVIYTLDLSN